MLITESFVMTNYPKTGSSFARKVIKDLYAQSPPPRWKFWQRRFLKELILPNIRHDGPPDQHGTYSQIPRQYRNREVVSVVRNPFERFLSGYEFRYWAHHPPLPIDLIRDQFPRFPDLSLDEYIDFNQFVLRPTARIGEQTLQFLQLFCKDPCRVIAGLNDSYIDSDAVFHDLAEVTFLRQEDLNRELAAFLCRQGFTPQQTAFIHSHELVNVTIGKAENRSGLLTPKAVQYVADRERLIFRVLDAKGIHYRLNTAAAA